MNSRRGLASSTAILEIKYNNQPRIARSTSLEESRERCCSAPAQQEIRLVNHNDCPPIAVRTARYIRMSGSQTHHCRHDNQTWQHSDAKTPRLHRKRKPSGKHMEQEKLPFSVIAEINIYLCDLATKPLSQVQIQYIGNVR